MNCKTHKTVLEYARRKGILTSDDWTDFLNSVPATAYSTIRTPSNIFALVQPLASAKQECFFAVTLDGAHQPIRTHLVSKGLVNRTVVHPREVFAPAIEDRAVAIIVAHNHPSGQLEPSSEDIEITRRLSSAGEILGINVLDHLIFNTTNWLSFVERGLLAPKVD